MHAYRSAFPCTPSLPGPGPGPSRSGVTARRRPARLGAALLGLLALITAAACSSEEAFLLLIRPPAGVAISQYEVTVQDRESRDIVYGSGIQALPPSAQGRDLSVEPLRIGLKLSKKEGTYLVQIILAASPVASRV